MNSIVSLKDLWKCLSTEEVEEGCRFLLESGSPEGKKLRHRLVSAVAMSYRYRPVFVLRKSPAEMLRLVVDRIRHPDLEDFRDDVIRGWLLARRRPMLIAFLDSTGVPHADGMVEEKAGTPAEAEFVRGISRVLQEFKPREAGLYFGYLLLYGGPFWAALPAALSTAGVSIVALLQENGGGAVCETMPSVPQAASGIALEDSDEFTTLDNLLIQTIVAAAFGEAGALEGDQIEDLVEEVTSLNAQRQHTLFHRGYYHALFHRSPVFHFPGENDLRRLWYFTGFVLGMLRGKHTGEVLKLLRDNRDLVGLLCEHQGVRCGGMLLAPIRPVLWEAREFGLLLRLLGTHLGRVSPHRRPDLVVQIYVDCSSMVRRGQWEEAEGFLALLDSHVRNAPDVPGDFREWFLLTNDRKRAQVFQLKGEFLAAERLLEPLVKREGCEDAGNALCDLALMKAGYRSLTAVLPAKTQAASDAICAALLQGRSLLERAVGEHPDASTNAHFCLGLLAFLQSHAAEQAADYFRGALAGMLRKEDAYSEGGLLQWNRFLLGTSLLETADVAHYSYASNLIHQSLQETIAFPLWIWSRAMMAAAVFDDQSLGAQIGEQLLRTRGTEAQDAIWASGLPVRVASLRQVHFQWLQESQVPLAMAWERYRAMLPAALKEGSIEQAEALLDAMECVAREGGPYRSAFLSLLEDDRNYSPAWTREEALLSRVVFHELEGNLVDAAALLRGRFFALREAGGPKTLLEAEAVLAEMTELGADPGDIEELRSLLRAAGPELPPVTCPLASGTSVHVLFIGGNETQRAYEKEIRDEFAEQYSGLRLGFYYPGWGSNWNVHLERVRPMIVEADAVVLSRMVRTQFGRAVRATCDSSRPWFACTGTGKQSLKRSIEAAALWAAGKASP